MFPYTSVYSTSDNEIHYKMVDNREDETRDTNKLPPLSQTSTELQPILQPTVLTAFIAGIALANFNKNLLMGFILGGLAGAYVQQSYPYQLPNVKTTWYRLKEKWRESQERTKKS